MNIRTKLLILGRIVYKRSIVLFFILMVLVSCVHDLDFGQADQLEIKPVYEIDFIYAQVKAPDFTNGLVPRFVPTLRDTLQDEFFSGDISDKLERVDLQIDLSNSINRGFEACFEFLDPSNTVLKEFCISTGSAVLGQAVSSTEIVTFDQDDLRRMETAVKLTSSLTMVNGATNLEGELVVKTKGTYYTFLNK